MAQIVERKPDFGESLGSALGTGLGTGLKTLAEHKVKQLVQSQQQTKAAQFWKSFGLPDQIAMSLAAQPESIQKSFLDRLEGLELGGGAQPTQEGQQLGDLKIGANPAERRHKEALQQRERLHVEKLNAPIIKDIREKSQPARQAVELSDNLLELLKTGKVKTGIKGALTPKYLQSEEGQQFLAGINQLVLLKAQLGKGVPTKLRLTLEQLSKPDVWQHPKTIERLLTKMRNDPEVQRAIAENEALESILETAGEEQPRDLQNAINKQTHQILSKKKNESQSLPPLPPASNYKEEQKAKNPLTGKYEFVIRNGQWERI